MTSAFDDRHYNNSTMFLISVTENADRDAIARKIAPENKEIDRSIESVKIRLDSIFSIAL